MDSLKWKQYLPSFLKVYGNIPIKNNRGGMLSPHMFACWCLLKYLNPKVVIESGVWMGAGTWLIQQALPNAKVYSIDPAIKRSRYQGKGVKYFTDDFSQIDWTSELPGDIDFGKDVVIFFDDHQDAPPRLYQMKKFGFKQAIFEDNYPIGQGDCYSLKQAFIKEPDEIGKVVKGYYVFPPPFKREKNRWDEDWPQEDVAIWEQIPKEDDPKRVLWKQATAYTYMCYVTI